VDVGGAVGEHVLVLGFWRSTVWKLTSVLQVDFVFSSPAFTLSWTLWYKTCSGLEAGAVLGLAQGEPPGPR
jgi:hypothetical protein